MNTFGNITLFIAWISALLGLIFGFLAGRRESFSFHRIAAVSTITTGVASTISTLALGGLFILDDYSNQYVWQFSSRDMPAVYKFSAVWGGMDGSMLLWAAILSFGGSILAYQIGSFPKKLGSWTLFGISQSNLFFLTVTLFFTNPFRYIQSEIIPADGNGLNPLLMDPFMAIHPPIMYFGLTWFAIPAAIALAALLTSKQQSPWFQYCRRWTLVAWGFLTAGKVLGGYWAYRELGWGGFWAWDPVENASFIPWLTGTAFLHSVMVEEKKGMLRLWNIWLAISTYLLTVYGTFLTRSGIVQSVHAFASTDIGWVFLAYLGIFLAVALCITIVRKKHFAPERHMESFFSREVAFLLNNLVLISIAFATLWGVMFPVFSEWLTGQKQTVGIPYFNAVNVPLFLFLIFLMGVGPLIAWQKAKWSQMKRQFLSPFITACVVSMMLVWAGIPGFYPIVSYGLCTFVFLTIIQEVYRLYRARHSSETQVVVRRTSRVLGGHIVHLGVLVAVIGITASMAHKVEKEFTLLPGQSHQVGNYNFTLKSLSTYQTPSYEGLKAITDVADAQSGKILSTLEPASRFYFKKRENTSEVSILKALKGDVYLVMAGLDETGQKAAMKVYLNPLQSFLWVGTVIMIIGLVVILLSKKGFIKDRE